jgi:hypothetical protein
VIPYTAVVRARRLLRPHQTDRAQPRLGLSARWKGRRRLLRLAGCTLALSGLVPFSAPAPRPWIGEPMVVDPDQSAPDPLAFSPEELQELRRRFGVHGPQPRLAQLFSEGVDQLQPLRNHTLTRIEELRPVILSLSRQQNVNPMLVTAVLFDEMRHAKPGENHPIAAHSGLFTTHGLAQLGIGEMQHQGVLSADPTPEEVSWARDQLLDPHRNIELLVGKFARLKRQLNVPSGRMLQASGSVKDAKVLATLAYLHNGKLDYPRRILSSMQDPVLHVLLYGQRKLPVSPLI